MQNWIDISESIYCYQKAVDIDPDFTWALTNMGALMNTMGYYDQAIKPLEKALQIKPDNVNALFNLANAWREKDQLDKAAEFYEKVVELVPDHAEAIYQLSTVSGMHAPDRPPAEYVEKLFDQYAWNFDRHLTGRLEYKTPELLGSELLKTLSSRAGSLDVLDIGCGTGLFGSHVRGVAKRLVGVDLSSKMLEKAREKGIYDELIVADAIDYMNNSSCSFDIVAAADVFPYMSDLSEAFAVCRAVLNRNGLFVFSVESVENGKDYIRGISGRYAHSIGYLRRMLEDNGFKECSISEAMLRKEKGSSIPGYLVVVRVDKTV